MMGSPNRKGSTNILVENFVLGATEAGHECERGAFRLYGISVAGFFLAVRGGVVFPFVIPGGGDDAAPPFPGFFPQGLFVGAFCAGVEE